MNFTQMRANITARLSIFTTFLGRILSMAKPSMPKFMRNFTRFLTRTTSRSLERVKRFIAWFPVIWDDNDFDYASVLYVMRFKLDRLADHLVEHDLIVNNKKYASQIKEVTNLIGRQLDDVYTSLMNAECEEKFGKLRWYSEFFPDENRKCSRVLFMRDGQNWDNYAAVEKEERKIYKKWDRVKLREWQRIWKLLDKNMQRWWD